MTHDNATTLRKGFEKAYKMIEDVIFQSLWDSAVKLLKYVGDIHNSGMQGWAGFTGNTQTSYACGIYIDGKLEGIVTQDNWHEPTRRRKVELGRTIFLKNPYEGDPRGVTGAVNIVDNHGLHLSKTFLEKYKAPRRHICLVMTTGTEYSEYIEEVGHLDVLTNTYEESKRVIPQNWKKIPD